MSENLPVGCPTDETLWRSVLDEVDDALLDWLGVHLDQCPACHDRVQEFMQQSWQQCLGGRKSPPDLRLTDESLQFARDFATQGLETSGGIVDRRMIGKYRLGRFLGSGGLGSVFEARDVSLDRTVAVKLLRIDSGSFHAVSRFEIEAKLQATLNHPGIVAVYDFSVDHGQPYLVMEMVRGGPLSSILIDRCLPPCQAASLMACVAEAVEHAHGHGVLHRDLKPANILLVSESGGIDAAATVSRKHAEAAPMVAKVADFGLAKLLNSMEGLTPKGMVCGTVAYLAPELVHQSLTASTPASDLYALGVVLYECLTGRLPFQGENTQHTLALISEQEPVAPNELVPSLPRDLVTICMKCLEKDAKRRFASAAEFAAELRRFLAGEPIISRPAGPAGRFVRWCVKRPYSAASVGLALVSWIILTIGGWVQARIQAELKEQVSRSHAEARYQAAAAETAARQAKASRDMAHDYFLKSIGAIDRLNVMLGSRDEAELEKLGLGTLTKTFRVDSLRLIDRFLVENDATTTLPETLAKSLSMGAVAFARFGQFEKSRELYGRMEDAIRVAEKNRQADPLIRFYAMNAAMAMADGLARSGKADESFQILESCIENWPVDQAMARDSQVTAFLLTNRRQLIFYLRETLASHGRENEAKQLDGKIAEIDSITKEWRAKSTLARPTGPVRQAAR